MLYEYITTQEFSDFGRFYYSAHLWRQGLDMYGPNPATITTIGIHFWNLNPPFLALLYIPFTLIPLQLAHLLWVLLTIGCLALAVRMVRQELQIKLSLPDKILLGSFGLSATPTLCFGLSGHLTGPVTLLLTGVWVALRRNQLALAAVLIGTAVSVRLFFAPLVLYLIVAKQWRAAFVSLATGAALFMLGVAVFGWTAHMSWLDAMRDVQWPWLSFNASLTSPFARVAHVLDGLRPAAPPGWVYVVSVSLSLGLLLLALWFAVRRFGTDASILLMVITCLLVFPLGWLYYWWIIIPPLVGAWHIRATRIGWWMSLPGWVVPWFMLSASDSAIYAATVGSVYFWALASMWLAAVVGCTQPGGVTEADV